MADRLSGEVGSLSTKTSEAATALQEAARQIGYQTQTLQSEAQGSEDKLKTIVSALQNEALQMRATLDKQAVEINAELSRVGSRFTELGGELRSSTRLMALNRVATHYNDITSAAASEFATRADVLGRTSEETDACCLSAVMDGQIGAVREGARGLTDSATQIAASSEGALDKVQALTVRFGALHEAVVDGTDKAVSQ